MQGRAMPVMGYTPNSGRPDWFQPTAKCPCGPCRPGFGALHPGVGCYDLMRVPKAAGCSSEMMADNPPTQDRGLVR
jgi:hypothetical protein